jgi:hypothetical protein
VRAMPILGLLLLAGCASIPEPRILGRVEAVRRSPSVNEARRLAPTTVAQADALADQARRVLDEDETGAEAAAQHIAEAALATYETARATSRAVLADRRRDAAAKQRDASAEELVGLEADLARQSADVVALERELAVLTELEMPKPSPAASAEREAARRVAARSLALDARLLCASAALLGADAATLAPAVAEVTSVEEAIAAPGATPIDRAARVRARCLEELTKVRRKTPPVAPAARAEASADALLAELSAARTEPSRDERGVVVVLRDVFDGDRVSVRGAARLAELDRVAAAHPAFPVLVVVHDGKPGKDEDAARGRARAAAAAAALPAAASRVRSEWAGAAAPVADPKGGGAARNVRLEVVFVAPSAF